MFWFLLVFLALFELSQQKMAAKASQACLEEVLHVTYELQNPFPPRWVSLFKPFDWPKVALIEGIVVSSGFQTKSALPKHYRRPIFVVKGQFTVQK